MVKNQIRQYVSSVSEVCQKVINLLNLDYSRVEVAVEARRKGCSCSHLPQILCNEVYTVRLARLKGKKCRL